MSYATEMPSTEIVRSEAEIQAEIDLRAWLLVAMTPGSNVSDLEALRVKSLRRGADISRVEWQSLAARIADEYVGPQDVNRAFLYSIITRIMGLGVELMETSELEARDRTAAGRLVLEAVKSLANLVGVQQPTKVEVAVTVEVSEADRLAELVRRVEATIIDVNSSDEDEDDRIETMQMRRLEA